MKLVSDVLKGDRLALSRMLTQVENGTASGLKALDLLFPNTGNATLIGITGPPGSGKSTLVNILANEFRHPSDGTPPKKVGIVAVDPSSPFSGGALLGDRIRMGDLAGDLGVFIRSMSSRGHSGGLAQTTRSLVQVLDAAGFDRIIIETVGAGQAEVEIAQLAHTVIVVEVPGLGDEIQAIKAGILEIADIFVINKADQPGVAQIEQFLRSLINMIADQSDTDQATTTWVPPIIRTIALTRDGLDHLVKAIERHSLFLKYSGTRSKQDRLQMDIDISTFLKERLLEIFLQDFPMDEYQELLEKVYNREVSPAHAVDTLIRLKKLG